MPLNGGAGIDTLTVIGTSAISSSGLKVANVESASLTSSGSVVLDTSSWTGLTSLTAQSSKSPMVILAGTGTAVTATALINGTNTIVINGGSTVSLTASGSITVGSTFAPTGTVTVSNSSSAAGLMGPITVKGGTLVKVTQLASNAVVNTTKTQGEVTGTGTAATTTVEVTNTVRATASVGTAGVAANSVTIEDVNAGSTTLTGTISTVAVSNVTTTTINSNALTNLSVKGGSGNIIIDNRGLTAPTNKALNLTLDGQTGGTLDDADIYTTLNLTATGSNSTLANITYGALTTLNLSGTQTLTLTNTSGMSALTSLKVSGSAGLTADTLSTNTKLTLIDASTTSGNVTVSIDGTKASYLGGSGIDTVTLNATPTKAVSGGAGTSDVLSLSAASAAGLTNAALVSGFEGVVLTSASNETIDTSNFVGATQFTTSNGIGLTLSDMVSGNTLQLTGGGTAYTISGAGFAAGLNDILNLRLIEGSGKNVAFASTGITATNVENIAITLSDTQSTPTGGFYDSLTLLGNGSKIITVSGTAGLTLTATNTGLTSVDASGITKGGFNWTSGSLTDAIIVKGSATGNNAIDLSAGFNAAATYTGGTGSDVVTIGNITVTNIINFGSGNDKLVLTGISTSAAAYAQTTGLSTGDIIDLSGARGGASNSSQSNLGTMLTGLTTFAAYLDASATAFVSTGNNAVLHWFQFGGNTYITQDTSELVTFLADFDTVVQLSGLVDLSTATVASGVVTLGAIGPV